MLPVGTYALLPNDSGRMSMNMMPCTAPGVRAFMSIQTDSQQKHERDGQPDRGQQPERVGADAEPHHVAEADEDYADQQAAEEVGQHGADKRHRAGDRRLARAGRWSGWR
jgi:hypothetical protein